MLELYGLKIKLAQSVYEPAEDTFLLISALEKLDLAGKNCLEIGTGSGIVALVLAKTAKNVLAVDINPAAVECANENASINRIKNIRFIESDLFSNVEGKFDLVVFNTPYLPDEPDSRDLALDGGKTGRKTIGRFIKDVMRYVDAGGAAVFLESSLSKYQKTLRYFKKKNVLARVAARKKFDWEELVVIVAETRSF